MTDNQDAINLLLDKLDALLDRQDDFASEINDLRIEIDRLKGSESTHETQKEDVYEDELVPETRFRDKPQSISVEPETYEKQGAKNPPKYSLLKALKLPKFTSGLEKFIGENLISKIGIIITVIGVSIGTKYVIDHDIISPLARIILGYLAGLGLLGFGIWLKKNYENYSAVLVGGAMAIMYFVTYSAYNYYDLIPQAFAFALMVIITIFTVIAAISYNRQIIAHIGLIGAYAIPFLLSESPEYVVTLFSYVAIINAGILVIAFKKYWKPLYYVSFGLTWLIYFSWYSTEYQTSEHFGLALIFLSIFFAIFYATFLAYKLIQKEKFDAVDVLLLLANSFLFYSIGYAILMQHETGENLLGAFTLCNAVVHTIVGAVIYKQKLGDRNLFYLVSGLVLVFITIAFPVQFDGKWVTLLWAGEAALMFWIGRTKDTPIYEKISYPLIALAFGSLLQDWTTVYYVSPVASPETRITPLLNINFLTSIMVLGAFVFINVLHRSKKYTSALVNEKRMSGFLSLALPAILLFTLYYAFRIEIEVYWNQLITDSGLYINLDDQQRLQYDSNYDYIRFKTLWVINYSLLFVSVLSFVNFWKFRSQQLGLVNLGLIVLTIAVFLTYGINALSELRSSYIAQTLSDYSQRTAFNIGIRYISFAFIAMAIVSCYKYIHQDFIKRNFEIAYDFLLHITVLWVVSSELINWMDMAESTESFKLGLSILWGVYSLLLIALGIWKKKKHLRIGAIALFGITLIKLFSYDISHLNTISKTIVFVSLGALLLIISFLYHKYKHLISDENEE